MSSPPYSDSESLDGADLDERADRVRMYKYGSLIVLGAVAAAYHLSQVYFALVDSNLHRAVHLGFMIVGATIVAYDPDPDGFRDRAGNAIALFEAALAVGVTYYLYTNFRRIMFDQIGMFETNDILAGLLMMALVFDATRRVYGPILPAVGVVGLIYAKYGPYFPGILNHSGLGWERLVQGLTVEYQTGLFGVITGVSATFIVVFMFLAGLLEAYGALNYFLQLGTLFGRRIKSGLAQMTTIASLGMGSINGSAAANAATTGAFTIPLLKRHGLHEDTAASFESVASSGGQIMPPIMGAAAFVMAELTGTPYIGIIKIALFPALLFYGSVAVGVHLTTMKEGIEEVDEDQEVEMSAKALDRQRALDDLFGKSAGKVSFDNISVRNLIVEGLALWIPVAVLLYTMVILLWDPLFAGFVSIVSAVPAAFLQSVLLREGYDLRDFAIDTLDGLGRGLENAAPIGVAIGVMNVFVGVMNLTAFAQTFASSLVSLSGGVLAVLLLLAMFAAVLFGLGMPTVAAYITAVLLIAPALADAGVSLLSAHFFVFYFAILSAITPPVAIACLVAARVSGGDFWNTCRLSLLLATPLFVLPYVFVVNESLLFWTLPGTIVTFLFSAVAFVGMSAALVNYLDGPLPTPVRGLLLASAGVVLFAPLVPEPMLARLGASALIVAVLVWQGEFLPDDLSDVLDKTVR